ncbi:MAG: bifunctional folylpolyglutamate synthase/dihydrofolate synthase [Nitrospirae bacterium]|nr:bifunctional folylpolyglutamate synthase/dihydrofolate synthase [Nitrospirota bacterium]
MSYGDTINYLYGLQKYGIKLGLDNTVKLLSCFNNPQASFKSVHIAGTNGKGSTSAMTASILQSAGFKVGLFTSPHLVSFTERIKVNNEQITESEVVELADEIKLKVERLKLEVKNSNLGTFEPTFFEVVTVMGFLYFKRKNVDWAVIETGMGGRLDATNVLASEVSVITSISYDHKDFLGETISAIAEEKAGVIKNRIPVVTSEQEPAVMDVIKKKAEERDSGLFVCGKDFSVTTKKEDINGSIFDYRGDMELEGLEIFLAGRHQILNAALAVKTSEVLIRKSAPLASKLTAEVIKSGIENTEWHGRLEFISDNPPILIDGAHNPSASSVLADSLRNNFLNTYRRIILIMGIMADKDIKGIMAPLLPLASDIIFTAPAYERAALPETLARHAASLGFTNIHIARTMEDAIGMAAKRSALSVQRSATKNPELIVITGSFYTIGEAKEVLGEKGVLSRLRE